MNKKILCFLLGLLMLSNVSCGSTTTAETTADTASASETATETATEDTSVKTGLPDDLDFAGASFRIHRFQSSSYYDTIIALEQTGDKLNDAIYSRDQKLMEDMNFRFEETVFVSGDIVSETTNQLLAGDDAYEMYVVHEAYKLAQQGFLIPISDLPYVDLSREYWSQSIHRDVSVGGKLYFAFGDYNLSTYDSVNVILFNKTMSEDLNLPDHYDAVLDGSWTLDLMEKNMHAASYDANGDGNWDINDQYGITAHPKQVLPVFWIASDMRLIEKDADDLPVFTLPSNEKFHTMYTRILSMMHNDHLLFMSHELPDYKNNTLFIEGRSLYNIVRIAFLNKYRDMDIDYGIIPAPKWDEAQKQYCSRTEGAFTHGYPNTLTQYELAGAVTEAMACASLNDIIPVYYDVILKSKYSRDENSTAMLDIIYDNCVFDLADTFFCSAIRDGVFYGKFQNNITELQSTVMSLVGIAEHEISTYIDAYAALN